MIETKYVAVEQYCIGTWNVWSMNQGKLDGKCDICIFGIIQLKWTGMGEFNSEDRIAHPISKFTDAQVLYIKVYLHVISEITYNT